MSDSTRLPNENGIHLAIKISSSVDDLPCVFCGEPCYPYEGPELFLADSWDMVCWKCGDAIQPEFVTMLGVYWDVANEALEEQEEALKDLKRTPAA